MAVAVACGGAGAIRLGSDGGDVDVGIGRTGGHVQRLGVGPGLADIELPVAVGIPAGESGMEVIGGVGGRGVVVGDDYVGQRRAVGRAGVGDRVVVGDRIADLAQRRAG